MTEPIISVSGLRGIVGESLTPEVAIRYAALLPNLCRRAGRCWSRATVEPTGRMIAQAVCSGLEAVGRDTIDAGVAATPTTGVLVRTLLTAGGVQISASHNPPEYNGLKLFSAEGRVIPAADGRRVLEQYRAGKISWVPHKKVGHAIACGDTLSAHCDLVLKTVDVERIRRRKFRVLLDSNHGAGSVLGRRLLDELGCQVTILGEKPDGQYEHTPEPTQENLSGVLSACARSGRYWLLPGPRR